jgi:hypothetical protein
MTIATLLAKSSVNVSESKQAPWIVIADAQQRNDTYIKLYSTEQIAKGERIKTFVSSVFPSNRVYLNYRQKFIAVKVEHVSRAEATQTQTLLLEDLCDLSGVTVASRGTNVIFRIMK